jgi:glutamate:Na+ symporter, ESS family
VIQLDLVQTVAVAGLVLFAGAGIRRLIPFLARYNIPSPVIGGLLVSLGILLSRQWDVELFRFDTTLQTPFMVAFFTTIGFGASVSLLRTGGPQVIAFFLISAGAAVAQNIIGMAVAVPLGVSPLLGVLAGSVTLTGGPATGLAFAPLFEQAGINAAASVAVAAAMVGIVSGGLIGGPIATYLIERRRLKMPRSHPAHQEAPAAVSIVEDQLPEPAVNAPEGEAGTAFRLLKNVVAILVAMWIGGWISRGFTALGATLPAYIGAMLAASAIRNLDDVTHLIGLSQRTIDDIGHVALSLFLAMALMTLRLWELAGLAIPLFIILLAQVALVVALCLFVVFRMMGRDYQAAVMCSGFTGFMLGTVANAMANMEALVEKYGSAPRAFFVIPMVGAFFIDFANALIITLFINLLS